MVFHTDTLFLLRGSSPLKTAYLELKAIDLPGRIAFVNHKILDQTQQTWDLHDQPRMETTFYSEIKLVTLG